jgi:hypothetical protein
MFERAKDLVKFGAVDWKAAPNLLAPKNSFKNSFKNSCKNNCQLKLEEQPAAVFRFA